MGAPRSQLSGRSSLLLLTGQELLYGANTLWDTERRLGASALLHLARLPASREGQDTERVQHERPHLGRAQLPLEGNNRNVSERQANPWCPRECLSRGFLGPHPTSGPGIMESHRTQTHDALRQDFLLQMEGAGAGGMGGRLSEESRPSQATIIPVLLEM